MATLLLAACLGALNPAPADADALYRRALKRTLARVQSELVASVDFVVDHSRWEDPWVVKSVNYEVRTTASYALAAQMAKDAEYMRDQFVRVLGTGNPIAEPLRIWILPGIGAYNQMGNDFGAEHSSMYGSFYVSQSPERPVATYLIQNRTQLGMWVTHGALHQYLEQAFGAGAPVWVEEGLAAYFSLYWDWAYGARELERLEASGFLPLDRLVNAPLGDYVPNAHDRFVELGMLFHFLLDCCEATKNGATGDPATGPFQEFLRAAVRGEDTSRTEFAQTFAEAHDLLEQDFRDWDFSR